jgi:hypothetical protein
MLLLFYQTRMAKMGVTTLDECPAYECKEQSLQFDISHRVIKNAYYMTLIIRGRNAVACLYPKN